LESAALRRAQAAARELPPLPSGQAFASCPSGYFCDYIYDNGYGVCFKVNPFRGYPSEVRDLFNYDFNSGSGPHNLVVGNDIASFTFSLSSCTNTPL
jgi:hypothetical protein